MMQVNRWAAALAAASCLAMASSALAQNSAAEGIAKYREALQDGNPAELWEARGEGLWKEPRGPRKVSLEQCDLGLGAGPPGLEWSGSRPRYWLRKWGLDDPSRLQTSGRSVGGH